MNGTLRSGFTTGTCAAAAAKAATLMLCGNYSGAPVAVELPDGTVVELMPEYVRADGGECEAAVRKDAGDDPDITNGILVAARVRFDDTDDVDIAGGEGVGTVTLPGLQVSPGKPAINPGPCAMIRAAVRQVTTAGVRVRIAIPGGEELARRTFNPRLGVVGGLSVLGTTGIVRPYSHAALRSALLCSLNVAAACGIDAPVMVPGNIGRRAAQRHFRCQPQQIVEVSNEWATMIDALHEHTFPAALIVGHPGKLAKLAMGYWDTHSSRSPGAVPAVLDLARACGITADNASPTVEGIFSSLTDEDRGRLATALAENIHAALRTRMPARMHSGVALIMMDGNCIGTTGDLTWWK